MTAKRIILEMGSGNDLYGGDYTKAACRAVEDALHHSSLTLFSTLDLSHRDLQVKVTIGVRKPEAVDRERVRAKLPRGTAHVEVVAGGLDVADPDHQGHHVIATAAIEAFLPLQPGRWQLSKHTRRTED
uniref:Lin0512 family protein n=1 Tax=Pararhizobium sp. IMCC3301 TaxID=3067904 RepID=UPI0027413EF5|nr:Lin0512 family protein [Pararhizobium sp. IMCC3301]